MPFYRGEVAGFHPTFPANSDAACKSENMPVGLDAPNIVYTAEDDAAIDDYHRRTSEFSVCELPTVTIGADPHFPVRTAWHAVSILHFEILGDKTDAHVVAGDLRHETERETRCR